MKAQHEKIYEAVPAMLRRIRREAGLTQVQVAKKIGKTQNWVWKSEIGERRVDVSEFAVFIHACGGTPADAFKTVADHAIACGKTRKSR